MFDLSLFRKYNEIKDKNILLGDHHTTKVVGVGEVRTEIYIWQNACVEESSSQAGNSKEFGLWISPQQNWLLANCRIKFIYFNQEQCFCGKGSCDRRNVQTTFINE